MSDPRDLEALRPGASNPEDHDRPNAAAIADLIDRASRLGIYPGDSVVDTQTRADLAAGRKVVNGGEPGHDKPWVHYD